MQLPALLSRKNKTTYKNKHGHVLIIAGSCRMLGASALCGLASMKSGAGLTTLAVPKSLNVALQKKISPVLMTLPLAETSKQAFSSRGWSRLEKTLKNFNALAIGPGITQEASAQNFIRKIIQKVNLPMVIDADGINALAGHLKILTESKTTKILTPHAGEFLRLIGTKTFSQKDLSENPTARKKAAMEFAKRHHCIVLLKGHRTVIASCDGKFMVNATGNAGMATAGSGDVLTGMIAAFLAQGLNAFEAAKWGAYLHGKAADLAVKKISKTSLIATDIIDNISNAFKSC